MEISDGHVSYSVQSTDTDEHRGFLKGLKEGKRRAMFHTCVRLSLIFLGISLASLLNIKPLVELSRKQEGWIVLAMALLFGLLAWTNRPKKKK